MSESPQPPIHLDIGGGTDSSERSADVDIEFDAMMRLRATRLAQDNPAGKYFVIDPGIDTEAAQKVRAEVPNVFFIKGLGDQLPIRPTRLKTEGKKKTFEKGIADSVEINHLFYPLTATEVNTLDMNKDSKLQAHKNEIVSQAPGMIDSRAVDSKAKRYEHQLEDEITLAAERLENKMSAHPSHAIADNYREYLDVLTEAASILKPGGELALAEKESRIAIIADLLQRNDSERLKECGLELVNLEENNEEHLPNYARRAKATEEALLEAGKLDKARNNSPMRLVLRKIPTA